MAQQTQHSKKTTTSKKTTAEKAVVKEPAVEPQEEQITTLLEDRHRMIAEAAYLIAEGRGFQGDMALDDWLQAEAEVDAKIAARH